MKPTLHFGGAVEGADAFLERTARSAAALRELGIGPGDAVAMLLRNEPVFLELALAARRLGARWCPIDWHVDADGLRRMLEGSSAKLLVGHADLLQRERAGIPGGMRVFHVPPQEHTCRVFGGDARAMREIDGIDSWEAFRDASPRPVPDPHTPPGDAMFYTSGTTGAAKGILRDAPTEAQIDGVTAAWRTAFGLGPSMRALVSAPLYHAAPATYAVQCALHDADLWIEPRFDAEETLRLIDAERISHLYLVPAMLVRLLRLAPDLRLRHDLRSVRFVACTGAPCASEVKRRMIEWWGPVMHESYAASELGVITHIDSEHALRKPGSVGRALPGATVRVLDTDGRQLPPGKVGLIYARHSAVPDFTYAGDASARRRLERGGLWTLGDLGYLDDDGYLYVVDREADRVVSGGVNIYPGEIEKLLMALPGVADCAVFGIPDDEYGEALAAAVQPEPAASLSMARVQGWLHERIAAYKVPRCVTFHDRLPREETGKIFKRSLRDPYWTGRSRKI